MNRFKDELLEMSRDRRDFIKKITVGAAGLTLNSMLTNENLFAANEIPGNSKVSFITGTDRRDMMMQVLKPFEQEIKEGIGNKQVVIKVNLVGPDLLCGTHVDAVRGVLDFLKPFYKKPVIVGDSTGRTYPGPLGTMKHYEIHSYLPLPGEYKIRLIDFNDESYSQKWILGDKAHPLAVNIIDTFLNPENYIISLTRMKTHSDVVATLTIKNVVMGSPVSHYKQAAVAGRNEKSFMHSGGFKNINYNIYTIAREVHQNLSIIDGLVGMEGNGPTQGTAVEHGIALAGTDMLAVDRVGVELMGIDFANIGYMNYISQAGIGQADLAKIKIIGPEIKEHIIKYKLHDNIEKQLTWKDGLVVNK